MPIGYSDIDYLKNSLTTVMSDIQRYQMEVKDQPNGGFRELQMLYSQLQVSRGFLSEIPAEQDDIEKTSEGYPD